MKLLILSLLFVTSGLHTEGVPIDENEKVIIWDTPKTRQQNVGDKINYMPSLNRQKRQRRSEKLCDFGKENNLKMCDWTNAEHAGLTWQLNSGTRAWQFGGPREDVTNKDDKGGYVFVSTNRRPENHKLDRAYLQSPDLNQTEPRGRCVKFSYAVDGESPEKLRLQLHALPLNENRGVVLWETDTSTLDKWVESQTLYTFTRPHKILLVGIPQDAASWKRNYNGHIAVDELDLVNGEKCNGHCSFEGGFCEWKNDKDAEFEWEISRGSNNRETGPVRDRDKTGDAVAGAFAFINSDPPRRHGDTARIISTEFDATGDNMPLCMRFWMHMKGVGIGQLKVYLKENGEDKEKLLWALDGDAGNTWHLGQVTLASKKRFKVVFQAEVGIPGRSHIAIDDISFENKVCLTLPEVASSNTDDMSCTFERGLCKWTNIGRRENLDEDDWERIVAESNDNVDFQVDHTLSRPEGFFLKMDVSSRNSIGSRAWLVSKELKGSDDPKCLTFWYASNEPRAGTRGTAIGSLTVFTKAYDPEHPGKINLSPIWRINNDNKSVWQQGKTRINETNDFQIIFEGQVGSNRVNGMFGLDDISIYEGECDE